MLEYNADTPTSLLESSVIQYHWLKDRFPHGDQFNSIHEELIARWDFIATPWDEEPTIHFTCVSEQLEDWGNTDYIRTTAEQAGLQTKMLSIETIGWDDQLQQFVDEENLVIQHLFKLYPWEWLLDDPYAPLIGKSAMRMQEPAWKLILSNKAILPLLWELFPNHPNLLPAYFASRQPINDVPFGNQYVKKPVFSREGANIEIYDGNQTTLLKTDGPYNLNKAVYQVFFPLPEFDGNYTVTGSWVIGGKSAGIGLREDESLITKNTSRFVPHYIR